MSANQTGHMAMADKKTAGRPTKYTDAIQKKADKYVDGGFTECGDIVPSRAGLALELRVSRETLTNWEKAHPKFLGTLERLSWIQERVSLNGGLKGELNSTIVKLLLSNHGYSESSKLDHTSSDGTMTPKSNIDASKLSDAALKELLAAKNTDEPK